MCGIVGWFSPHSIAAGQVGRLRAMATALSHRGPDGDGYHVDTHAALGHRRLSIIDIEGGAQPMRAASEPVYITFNGEIYNYKELRENLRAEGCAFRSESDTEVILQLYLRHGIGGFRRLKGMYAFGIWDGRADKGILARDPVGIKPLFMQRGPSGQLAFGSEAKAILAGAGCRGVLEESSLHLLMNFRYIPGQRSLFQGIRQLAPGHVLEWCTDGTVKDYPVSSDVPTSPDDAGVLDLLQESVTAHLTADVEVGAYLSGGIDSATVVALCKQAGHRNIKTFTLDVGDDPLEAENAAMTSRLLAVRNHRGRIESDVETRLRDLIWHLELPKINALQVSELARYASQFGKVVLSGVGGDEVFLGYNAHRIIYTANSVYRRVPRSLRRWTRTLPLYLNGLLPSTVWSERERACLMYRELGDWPRVYGLLRNVWDSDVLRRKIYGPRMLDASLPDAFETLRAAWPDGADPVAAMAEFEWREKMVNDLLWQEDRCSMAVGLEVRVPFLEQRFAAAVRSLGTERLMPDGRLKGYMKSMIKPLLPAEVLRRRKSGFQVNAPVFFQENLVGVARELLSDERVRHYGLFNPAFVKNIMARGPSNHLRWHYFILYLMLTTHIWVEQFEQPV